LVLEQLKTLSVASARSLAKVGGELTFGSQLESGPGLTEITDEVAQCLAEHKGPIFLDSITTLSETSAKAFGNHEGTLSLKGLHALTKAAAKGLGKHRGELQIGLKKLDPNVALALAENQGDLVLNGITNLSDEAANCLSKHQGGLWLYSLTEISVEAMRKLVANHKGEVRAPECEHIVEAAETYDQMLDDMD
jgi:hypothetical protein